jgi:hypothetical protein
LAAKNNLLNDKEKEILKEYPDQIVPVDISFNRDVKVAPIHLEIDYRSIFKVTINKLKI